MAHYICGIYKPSTGATVLAESWDDNVYAYEGFNAGAQPGYGCKGKQDYLGRFWFFAFEGDPADPDVLYLVRATLLPGDTIELKYAAIPEVEYEATPYVVKPNQLTVDKNGYVFFPAGAYTGGVACTAVMFGVDVSDNDPLNWVFTYLDTAIPTLSGALGVALNKDHSKLMCYCSAIAPMDFDKVVIFDNDNDGTVSYNNAVLLAGWTEAFPYCDNIETDVSGSLNDGFSYFILQQWDIIVAFSMDTEMVAYTWDAPGSVVAVDALGFVTVMLRINQCPGSSNLMAYYLPWGGGGLGWIGNMAMVCPMSTPTHHDHVRVPPFSPYESTGLTPETGEIRENGAVTVYTLADYREVCAEGPREDHT